MTTQWTADAYEGFSLSEEKKADCKRIAMILVHEALRHYQKFDQSVPREMDSEHWKSIKSSKNITMYRERNPIRRVVKDSHTGSAGWQLPRIIIGNGTIASSMDDLLFGLAYGDEAAGFQGMSYAGQQVTDYQILSTVEKPTLEHPYRCTTLEWNSGSPNTLFRGVVKDRDAVYIRATGILQLNGGERVGYNLMHSIDLPTTPPLGRHVIRSRISSCLLFKPITDHSVEVFAKSYYEVIGNNILDSIGVVTVPSALMDNWTSAETAKRKKLSWLLQNKNASKNDVAGLIATSEVGNKAECLSCKKRFGPLRKAYPCILCHSPICGKCILPMKLLDIVPKLQLISKKVYLCPACDNFAEQISSYQVARQEIQAGRYEKDGSGSTIVEPSRISQLTEESSDLLCKESSPGELYEFDSDQRSPSTEGSLNAFAQFTSPTDAAQFIENERKSSDQDSLVQRSPSDGNESDTMVEKIWKGSISELDLNDQERGRQLAWLKMTELRLRLDDSTTLK